MTPRTAYHRYIYDFENRRIVGDFEGAYANLDKVWPGQFELDRPKYRLIREWLRSIEPLPRVLDIGCGYGAFVAQLRSFGIDAHGVEISPSAIAKGRERHPDLPIRVGDLTQGLSDPDRAYEVVTLLGVMWFLVDHIDGCLAELHRLLSPGGLLFVSVGIDADPIAGEKMPDYDALCEMLRRRFDVIDGAMFYNAEDLSAGGGLDESATDVLLIARRRDS